MPAHAQISSPFHIADDIRQRPRAVQQSQHIVNSDGFASRAADVGVAEAQPGQCRTALPVEHTAAVCRGARVGAAVEFEIAPDLTGKNPPLRGWVKCFLPV